MSVTIDELKAIATELFTACDKDGSGFLEKAELRTVAGNLHAKITEGKADAKEFNEEKFEKGFSMMDKSGDGKISFDEAFTALTNFARNNGHLKEWVHTTPASLYCNYVWSLFFEWSFS